MPALYYVINLVFNNPPGYTIPKNLIVATDRFQHNINIEEVCNGIIHPITKETITKYTKLMNDPALKDLWVLAMSKELQHLAQGKEGITVGTNTIFYLTHDEIRRIPKDRTVTYARIVIDEIRRIPKDQTVTYARIVINHRSQKDDPNRVRIMVGGNLIDYPYKLTTQTADMVSAKIMWNSVISTPGAKFASSFQTTSLNTTISRKKHSLATFTWKSDVECMVYHKPAS